MSNRKDHLDADYPVSHGRGSSQQAGRSSSVKYIMCESCGIPTHQIERSLFGKKKVPLNDPGMVLRGICLTCNGPEGSRRQPEHEQAQAQAQAQAQEHEHPVDPPPHPAGVPQELVVKNCDDQTVVSQITLDHRFDTPDESDDESDHFRVTPGQRRPEPSLGDPEEYERPSPLRPRRSEGRRRASGNLLESNEEEDVVRQREWKTPATPTATTATTTTPTTTATTTQDNLWGTLEQEHALQQQQQQQQATHNNPYLTNNHIPQIFENQVMHHHRPYTTSQPQPQQGQGQGPYGGGIMGHPRVYASAEKPPSIASEFGQEEEKVEIEPDHHTNNNHDHDHPWSNNNTNSSNTSTHPPPALNVSHLRTLADIPELVNHLHTCSSIGNHAVAVLDCMTHIVWNWGQAAKEAITNSRPRNGLEALTKSMWDSMADAAVQEAALNLIFALVSSQDGMPSSDVFTGTEAEDVVDALLIVMQTHLTVENIQHTGCGTLGCLAAASMNNAAVDDASLSGALETVVSAMEAHRNSHVVQCTGIRALYNQCVYSRHAESNKRVLSKTGMEEKKCGAAVIYRAIEISEGDIVILEWACRLYWCLSASEDVAEFLTVTNHPIYLMLEALQRSHQRKDAEGLLQAILGALANLSKVRDNHKVLDSSVLYLVVKAAQTHPDKEDLLVEACALIANLVSLSTDNADAAVEVNAMEIMFDALQAFPESGQLFEEALRSLASLCLASEEAKRVLSTPAMLLCLSRASSLNSDSAFGQEMFINLIASLLTQQSHHQALIAHGGLDAMFTAMRSHPNDRRVQEAACLAMRNLACNYDLQTTNIDLVEPVHLVVQAMARHASSESIQLNGCCTLWNVACMNNSGIPGVSDEELIQSIVKAMQTHMESASVLEMACGALCSKISGSQDGKKCLVDSGGLDAVTCVLVMHPTESATLEKAFAVLSSMSASTEFADDVASAQCMTNVVEAMRANSSSITLLEFGCLVLRNIILLRPEHVSESSSVVATILNGMRNHPDAVAFQREACSLLWAMTAVSESCKDKVLSLDGIAVLLGCLEHNSSFADVQDAALGAFNQLTPGMVG